MKKLIFLAVAALVIGGCAGKVEYTKPSTISTGKDNSIVIEKPRDIVWGSSVPELGKRFFVINNMDKDSGLINISYSGDPEKYIDCGRISSFVKNLQGERTYDFPASSASKQYEIMVNGQLANINRKMILDGRVNLIFEDISKTKTKVTANTKYVVQKHVIATPVGTSVPISFSDNISFNSGSSASFPGEKESQRTECVPTGELEREILSAIR